MRRWGVDIKRSTGQLGNILVVGLVGLVGLGVGTGAWTVVRISPPAEPVQGARALSACLSAGGQHFTAHRGRLVELLLFQLRSTRVQQAHALTNSRMCVKTIANGELLFGMWPNGDVLQALVDNR